MFLMYVFLENKVIFKSKINNIQYSISSVNHVDSFSVSYLMINMIRVQALHCLIYLWRVLIISYIISF